MLSEEQKILPCGTRLVLTFYRGCFCRNNAKDRAKKTKSAREGAQVAAKA